MALGDGIRRNIATVSQEERDRLRDAIIKLQTQQHYPGARGDSPVGGVSYWFKQDEIHANTHVHFCPAFVPWHRELINRFEALIQEIDPQLSLHYWDWTQDPQNLPDGQGGTINLFTSAFFGQPNANLPGEPMQADAGPPWRLDGFYVPNADPYRSDIENDPGHDNPFDPPLDLPYAVTGGPTGIDDSAALAAGSFKQFHDAISVSHGAAHGYIGGILSDPHTSFRSPVAYLLHSNLDRIWAMWQRAPGHPQRVDPVHVYDHTPGEWSQDPELGAGDLSVSQFPWWGFKSPMEPWAGPAAQTMATGVVANVAPVRPWAPPENQQVYKDSRDPTVVFPPSYDTVPHSAYFILDRSNFSGVEVQSQPAYAGAMTLIFDGFTTNELGGDPPPAPSLQMTFDSPNGPSAAPYITVAAEPALTEGGGPDVPQRISFPLDINFVDPTIFNSFTDTRFVYLVATDGITVAQTAFELSKQPNPYMLDGAISWLSKDVRVFKLFPGQNLPSSATVLGNDPLAYINNLLTEFRGIPDLNDDPSHPFQQISQDEVQSQLEAAQTIGGTPVFNFAVAKVRYRANTTPTGNVQVFFRTFSTMRSALDYSYAGSSPPTINYTRSGAWPNGVPLLGIIDGEIASIPYFAVGRVDSTATSMANQLLDTPNIQNINADAGQEAVMFFGCWLDFNQPQNRFPFNPPDDHGPFTSGAQPIPAVISGLHECLVAEIFYQPGGGADPIPSGSTPASSDRLAQRNLAIDPSGNPGWPATHTVAHSFMIKPSLLRAGVAAVAAREQAVVERFAFDELMIRWNDMPRDTKATLYVPEWDVDQVLQLAATRQHPNVLHKVDAHTLSIDLADSTFVPIPDAPKNSYAGLITLTLPDTVRTGQVYRADFQQIARLQRFNGSFRFTVPIGDETRMLPDEIRRLAILRYIAEGKPAGSRWLAIFNRWIATQAGKVKGLGGDPDQVPPSLTDPQGAGEPEADEFRMTGKVRCLFYDCFGDFEGFDLEECTECHHFTTGERGIEEIIRRACHDRSWVTVLFDDDSRRIRGIVIECMHHRS
jgi:hypothetical protein